MSRINNNNNKNDNITINDNYNYPLRMISVSTITGMVRPTRLFEVAASSSGLELLTVISILMGLAFDSLDNLSLSPLPTTSGRIVVFKETLKIKKSENRLVSDCLLR